MTEITAEALSLDRLIAENVRALIRRFHLNRDWIIGLIGYRGAGKSLGGANIALRDFMFSGEKCWSNMAIRLDVELDDDDAEYFGLDHGGIQSYHSEYIDKQSFLTLDSRYEGSILFFDEFNLEYGEARRSIANVNLMTDRAIQQLRKLQSGLIYTVLNEMYVDPRIRENTDVFIKCSDTAFNPGSLKDRKPQGREFEWMIYGMHEKFTGNGKTYNDTHKAEGPIPVELGDLWGSIDTYERQAVGQSKYGGTQPKHLVDLKLQDTPDIKQEKDKYALADELIDTFFSLHQNDGNEIKITSPELRNELNVPEQGWNVFVREHIRRRLPDMQTIPARQGMPTTYIFKNRILQQQ